MISFPCSAWERVRRGSASCFELDSLAAVVFIAMWWHGAVLEYWRSRASELAFPGKAWERVMAKGFSSRDSDDREGAQVTAGVQVVILIESFRGDDFAIGISAVVLVHEVIVTGRD